jgi:hypothetical protein
MNRPARIGLIALGLGLVLTVSGAAYSVYAVYFENIAHGNRIAREIDAYSQRQGHLPSSLEDVGEHESEDGPIYYMLCGNSHYILWFGTMLGHSMTYDSVSRSWDSLNSGCPSSK